MSLLISLCIISAHARSRLHAAIASSRKRCAPLHLSSLVLLPTIKNLRRYSQRKLSSVKEPTRLHLRLNFSIGAPFPCKTPTNWGLACGSPSPLPICDQEAQEISQCAWTIGLSHRSFKIKAPSIFARQLLRVNLVSRGLFAGICIYRTEYPL